MRKIIAVTVSTIALAFIFSASPAFAEHKPRHTNHGRPIQVPEPASTLLFGMGLASTYFMKRHIDKRNARLVPVKA